jgi:predicted nuclease of restriction endonuclease-like (RecB) superfamily
MCIGLARRQDLKNQLVQAREGVARAVDSGLTTLYWHVGRRIRRDILKEKRADYGGQIVAALGPQLEVEFGRGFAEKNLRRVERAYLAAEDQRDVLRSDSALPEAGRTGAVELKHLRDKITPDLVFRDPYILDFLGLKDTYAEKDLEAAILREMEAFLLELGVGFCFVARQQRMQIDDRDCYLDLLFYHRKLRRLIAIDLKPGKFEAGDKGQMELYLGRLKRYACQPDEAEPRGMILCAGKSEEHIALLELQKSGIRGASYWTEALPREQLEPKLHEAVRLARARLEGVQD